jgi:hypothetical protein
MDRRRRPTSFARRHRLFVNLGGREEEKNIFGRAHPSAIRVILFYLGRKGEAQIKFLSELLNLE